jgi:hypothetical protein
MDILKEAQKAAMRGEVKSCITATLHDLMMDIGNNISALLFEHSQETFVATVLALGAMDVWSDFYNDGLISIADLIVMIDEALSEMHQPGPICTQCLRVARCGACPDCRKAVCRECLVEHLETHG